MDYLVRSTDPDFPSVTFVATAEAAQALRDKNNAAMKPAYQNWVAEQLVRL